MFLAVIARHEVPWQSKKVKVKVIFGGHSGLDLESMYLLFF
jgi:hypothetical protein